MFIMWNPGWRREVTSDDIGPDGADTGEMGNGCVNSVQEKREEDQRQIEEQRVGWAMKQNDIYSRIGESELQMLSIWLAFIFLIELLPYLIQFMTDGLRSSL